MSLNQEFAEHSAWRCAQAQRIQSLCSWLEERPWLDPGHSERLQALQLRLRHDKIMLAFVAEFSRGKSELINAVFFSDHGRRILPARAGRTTMCPTEIGHEAALPPSLSLLPIETRLQPRPLQDWRSMVQQWECIELDLHDPEQLTAALEKVAEVSLVSVAEARALGFWNDSNPDDNPRPEPDGRVEVPRWRYALINMAHPLLDEGLVILDTPGLNAIGAEPELTMALLTQAQAAVFVLAADLGVSRSDLAVWRDHLQPMVEPGEPGLVVLNKIDTLWDELSTPEQVQAQIGRQCGHCAAVLGLKPEQVLPVSAQKGLLAKVRQDSALLAQSRLPALELALAEGVLQQHQSKLRAKVNTELELLGAAVEQQLQARSSALAGQLQELEALRSGNAATIQDMRLRIEQEQGKFQDSGTSTRAISWVHQKLLRGLLRQFEQQQLESQFADLAHALVQPGVKLNLKPVYADTFARLRSSFAQAQALADEIDDMLTGAFRKLNREYGLNLQLPQRLDLSSFVQDLTHTESIYLKYLGLGNLWRLAQAEFGQRLKLAMMAQLRCVYDAAATEAAQWSKAATAQLELELHERQGHFVRRLEALQRIETAAGGLDERIAQLQDQHRNAEDDLSELKNLSAGAVQADALQAANLTATQA